jgi:hypothetical protein
MLKPKTVNEALLGLCALQRLILYSLSGPDFSNLEGRIDGETFTIYVEKVLLPTLRPGALVIMDNLGSHRGKTVHRLIRSVGANYKLSFLLPAEVFPRPQPDRTGVRVFAKLKHLLRKAAPEPLMPSALQPGYAPT